MDKFTGKFKDLCIKLKDRIWSFSMVRLFVACFIIIFIVEAFGRHSAFESFSFLFHHPIRYIMNVFLIMTPYTVFYLIRKRSIGYILVSFAWLAFGVTNGVVLAFRVTPFSTIDFRLVDAALGVMGNYLEIWQMILVGILAVLAIVFVIYLIIKIKRYEGDMHYARNTVLIVCYWLCIYFGMRALVHAGVFSTVLPNLAYAYKDYGASYCFVVTGMRNGIRKPINYTEQRMAGIKKGIDKEFDSEKKGKEPKKANIIFLQLESFFDINYVKNYIFNENPIPYFTYLKNNYSSGFLTVPAFGAGTANTEFEVMTGMRLGAFSPGEYPYKTILRKRTCESVGYDLKTIGYTPHAIHNNTATFYSRSKVFTNLGYETFSSIETMDSRTTTKTGWAKDYILINEIDQVLRSTDTPDYIYTISVQGHGDYYKEAAKVDDPEVMVSNVSERSQEDAVNYYVEQIREMDDFVRQLCKKLENFEEDTLLVLYGDHLPGLGFENEDLKNGDVFQTEYIIWSNFGLKKKDQDLAAYQLSAEVLDRLNIHTGTVMRYHQHYRGKKKYQSRLYALQYDMLYGNQYVYEGENRFLQTDMRFGVKDVQITSALVSSEDKTVLYGSHFTQCSHVFVNGEEVDANMIGGSAISFDAGLKDGDEVVVKQLTAKRKVLQESEPYIYHLPDKTEAADE